MEHPARFELSAAFEAWRGELLAQPAFTPDDRRELESHLCDAMAESRDSGMDDERAFAHARDRLGQLPQIAAEFARIDPARVWRERAFWMAVSLVLSRRMGNRGESISRADIATPAGASPVAGLLRAFAWHGNHALARAAIAPWTLWIGRIIHSRARFVVVMAAVIMPLHWADVASVFRGDPLYWIIAQWLSMALRDIFLIALAAWLMPAQYRAHAGHTGPAPAAIWHERVFWMTLALLVKMICHDFGLMSANVLNDAIAKLLPSYSQYRAQAEYSLYSLAITNILYSFLAYLPPLCLMALLSHGRAGNLASWLGRVFNSRTRLVLAAIVGMCAMRAWYLAYYDHEFGFIKWRILLWNFAFVALAAWLMPVQTRKPHESD